MANCRLVDFLLAAFFNCSTLFNCWIVVELLGCWIVTCRFLSRFCKIALLLNCRIIVELLIVQLLNWWICVLLYCCIFELLNWWIEVGLVDFSLTGSVSESLNCWGFKQILSELYMQIDLIVFLAISWNFFHILGAELEPYSTWPCSESSVGVFRRHHNL